MTRLASSLENVESAADTARISGWQVRERSLGVAALLRQTARTLDQSADLAEEHARRQECRGQQEAAEQEWRAAGRARAAAERARTHAAQWQSSQR
ncbi:MAG TPA: hypothetical protein VME22_32600 [Solirubrobacteraceae bacterium]|nr:hypothetical protein [Solirubrobacteraceae bacterium]